MTHFSLRTVLCLSAVFSLLSTADAGDWARFRGPNGTGVSTDTASTPVEFSETKNLKWKLELPGPGSSSPIVVGNKVFVTCWTGYGTSRQNTGAQENLKRHLICVDRNTGEILWNQPTAAVLPEDTYRGMFAENGYATHTPVSDGERVYVFYGKSGVLAYDLEGKKLWQKSVGTSRDPKGWGSSCSPVLYKNLLIITASAESESLVAFDKVTGEQVWKQEAAGFGATWGTPILTGEGENAELVLGVPYEIWGFNPTTGKLKWYCEALPSSSMCASVVANDGVIYAVGGREGGSIAVRTGGKDDVTKSHVVWKGRDRARIGTPLLHDGHLYWISSGVANCVDAGTGERVYQSRIRTTGNSNSQGGRRSRGGQDYSSPVAADGKMYYTSRNGTIHVIQLGAEYKYLASNRFESDNGDFSSTPAISNGEIFIRSSNALYCVAETEN